MILNKDNSVTCLPCSQSFCNRPELFYHLRDHHHIANPAVYQKNMESHFGLKHVNYNSNTKKSKDDTKRDSDVEVIDLEETEDIATSEQEKLILTEKQTFEAVSQSNQLLCRFCSEPFLNQEQLTRHLKKCEHYIHFSNALHGTNSSNAKINTASNEDSKQNSDVEIIDVEGTLGKDTVISNQGKHKSFTVIKTSNTMSQTSQIHCNFCSRSFLNHDQVTLHLEKCKNFIQYRQKLTASQKLYLPCRFCSEYFLNQEELTIHLERKHYNYISHALYGTNKSNAKKNEDSNEGSKQDSDVEIIDLEENEPVHSEICNQSSTVVEGVNSNAVSKNSKYLCIFCSEPLILDKISTHMKKCRKHITYLSNADVKRKEWHRKNNVRKSQSSDIVPSQEEENATKKSNDFSTPDVYQKVENSNAVSQNSEYSCRFCSEPLNLDQVAPHMKKCEDYYTLYKSKVDAKKKQILCKSNVKTLVASTEKVKQKIPILDTLYFLDKNIPLQELTNGKFKHDDSTDKKNEPLTWRPPKDGAETIDNSKNDSNLEIIETEGNESLNIEIYNVEKAKSSTVIKVVDTNNVNLDKVFNQNKNAAQDPKNLKEISNGESNKLDDYVANKISNIQQELKAEHGKSVVFEPNKPFKCVFCGKRTAFKASFKKHLMIEHKEIEPKCIICGKKLKNNVLLNIHLLKCHGEKNLEEPLKIKKYVCKTCKNCFTRENTLKTHIKKFHKKMNTNQDILKNNNQTSNIDVKSVDENDTITMQKSDNPKAVKYGGISKNAIPEKLNETSNSSGLELMGLVKDDTLENDPFLDTEKDTASYNEKIIASTFNIFCKNDKGLKRKISDTVHDNPIDDGNCIKKSKVDNYVASKISTIQKELENDKSLDKGKGTIEHENDSKKSKIDDYVADKISNIKKELENDKNSDKGREKTTKIKRIIASNSKKSSNTQKNESPLMHENDFKKERVEDYVVDKITNIKKELDDEELQAGLNVLNEMNESFFSGTP